jgi:hypothetical protein
VPGRGQFNLQTPRHADGQPTASASTTGIPAPESVLAAAPPLASCETPDREPDPPGAKMAVAQGTSRLLRQPPGTLSATRAPAAGERIEHGRISGEQSSSRSRRSPVARPRRTSSSPGRAFTGSTSCG